MPSNSLHVGLYSPELPESGVSNGIVTYTGIMRDALQELGHSVTVVTAKEIQHSDGRVAQLAVPRGLVGRARTFVESRYGDDGLEPWLRLRVIDAFQAARRAGVQVFEIEESFGWARRLTGRGVPVVERLHGPHCLLRNPHERGEQKRLSDLREAAEAASFATVQAVTSPTQRLLDVLSARHVMAPLTRAIPNPMPMASPERSWQFASANPDQILVVGRFDSLKGADVALRAFALALEQRPSLRLIMAGPDPGLDSGDAEPLHFGDFAARELPQEARARIDFLGPQPPERISALRLQSAVALVTSRFENFPYSIAEAMAVGMPVIATSTFGGAEMIRDGIDGRIVRIDGIEDTAQAIVATIDRPELLMNMGKSAQARVSEWLSPSRVAKETAELYAEVADRGQANS